MVDTKIAGKILREIKKANSVLLSVHVSPDPDSVCCVLAASKVLKKMGIRSRMISYSFIPSGLKILSGSELIEIKDFSKLNLGDYDLFIALDTAQETKITESEFPKKLPSGLRIINIDHHITNTKFGDINLIEPVSSTAEILYKLFKGWKVKIDRSLAQLLFYGIFTDSGCFQYFEYTSPQTLTIAADLMKKGASLKEAVLNDYRSYSLNTLKYWGKVLENMRMDEGGGFVFSTISCEEREGLGVDPSEIAGASSLFGPIVLGTEFGIILNEESSGLVRGSLRSRDGFDVSAIAAEFGGGGHRQAAGFSLSLPLDQAVEKVLFVARKHIKQREGV